MAWSLRNLLALPCTLLLAAAPPVAQDPLADLNAAFRSAYAAVRSEALAHQGPVVVVSGDTLVLYRDQVVVAEAVIRPALYHRLKSLAHVPLAVRLTVRGLGEGPLAPEGRAVLEALQGKLVAATGALEEAFPGGAAGQAVLLAAGRTFLEGVLARGRVSGRELDAYSRAMEVPLSANAAAAAALELEALARVLRGWRGGPLASDWNRFNVVVIGSHMAREGEVAFQFFSRLLGEPREGGRVVFAEGLWDPKDALTLLASHGVDRDLGEGFFGDPWRLHRDVLGDAAKIWLDSHPPGP